MAAMASSLLKASSYYNYTNQTINRRRIIIIPTATTRISVPKITTATSSSSSRGSTFRVHCVMNSNKNCFKKKKQVEEEKVPPFTFEIFRKLMLKVFEKFALPIILVWIFFTKNPAIASSSLRRTATFFGVWIGHGLCKVIYAFISQCSRTKHGEPINFPVSSLILLWYFPLTFAALLGFVAAFLGFGSFSLELKMNWTQS